jgi:hypothetical protein
VIFAMVGEIKLVISGQKFDKNLPAAGKFKLIMPNGYELFFDVIDLIDLEWYEEIE